MNDTLPVEEERKIRFNPTISFDGVAIIIACIAAAIAWGTLKQTVHQHDTLLQQHSSEIGELKERTDKLEVRVDERTERVRK